MCLVFFIVVSFGLAFRLAKLCEFFFHVLDIYYSIVYLFGGVLSSSTFCFIGLYFVCAINKNKDEGLVFITFGGDGGRS